MRIEKVECRCFRNLENISVHLKDKINVVVGKNGQGKTNFLECIYFISTTRSFRTNNDKDLIMDNQTMARVDLLLNLDVTRKNLRCIIHDQGKSCFISRVPIAKTSEFIGNLNAILFVPSELELFNAAPKIRRKMMDIEIGKIDSYYSYHLNKFNYLMKERNYFFKLGKEDENFLDVIEKQMIESQKIVIKKRIEFIDLINQKINIYYEIISNEKNYISCHYKNFSEKMNIEDDKSFINLLKESRERDRILKSTSIGIHRDDLEFQFDGKYLDSCASQGQRRMVVLALKLVFIDYVIKIKNELPVLLLDDVLSELDIEKRNNLFKAIPKNVQTIITTTDIDDFIIDVNEDINILKMSNGKL